MGGGKRTRERALPKIVGRGGVQNPFLGGVSFVRFSTPLFFPPPPWRPLNFWLFSDSVGSSPPPSGGQRALQESSDNFEDFGPERPEWPCSSQGLPYPHPQILQNLKPLSAHPLPRNLDYGLTLPSEKGTYHSFRNHTFLIIENH